MPDSAKPPEFTVVYPEFDVRGNVADHLRAWTVDQTLPRDRYRVVVVLAPDSDEEAVIRKMLGTEDKIIRESVVKDTAMWNAGAAVCDTPWLVFTEGHSPAQPECLEALDKWLASNPEATVGNFEIGHPEDYRMAKISDRWFGEQGDKWEESWPRVHRAGFAIRRDVFEKLGKYGPFGQFAPPLLSAKLHSLGHGMELVPEARTIHVDDRDLYGHHFDTIDFVLGECQARELEPSPFFEEYFGHNATSRNRLTLRPDFFFETLKASARFIYQRRKVPPGLARNLLQLFSESVRHSEFSTALNEAITLLEETTLLHFPIPDELRYRWFVRAHRRVVETNANKWVKEQGLSASTGLSNGLFPVAEVDPWSLSGVHSLETVEGRHFRWSEPFFTIRLAPGTTIATLQIETNRLRAEKNLGILFVACGGFPLPNSCISVVGAGTVKVHIPERFSKRVDRSGITFTVTPVSFPEGESADERSLGLPIFSIEVQ